MSVDAVQTTSGHMDPAFPLDRHLLARQSFIDLTIDDDEPTPPITNRQRRRSRSRSSSVEYIGSIQAPRPARAGPSATRSSRNVATSQGGGNDNDDIQEVDALGRPVPFVNTPLLIPGTRNLSHTPIPGIRILDSAPVPPSSYPRTQAPLTHAETGAAPRTSRLGGALLSLRRPQFRFAPDPHRHYPGPDLWDEIGADDWNWFTDLLGSNGGGYADLLRPFASSSGARAPDAGMPATPFNAAEFCYGGRTRPRAGFTFDWSMSHIEKEPPKSSMWNTITSFVSTSTTASTKRKAIDVDALSSSSSDDDNIFTLICAACDTPLLLGQDGDGRVWGLQCGHMICGACLARPPFTPPPLPSSDADSIPGKGKARAILADEETLVPRQTHPRVASLRSRVAAGETTADSSPPLTSKPKRGRKGKGKAKALASSAAAPAIVKRREWSYACPVEGCARTHVREYVDQDGIWVGKDELGEIAVYT